MENTSLALTKAKIVPLARKKLLAKALMKDSPIKVSVQRRRMLRSSASNSISDSENIMPKEKFYSTLTSPLKEKDLNKEIGKQKVTKFMTNVRNCEEFFVKLWKCNKMNAEVDIELKFETEQIFYSLRTLSESGKIVFFITELNRFFQNNSAFPHYLSPYLEEIVCLLPLSFPLIKDTSTIFEAESLLSLAICRFSIKKLEVIFT